MWLQVSPGLAWRVRGWIKGALDRRWSNETFRTIYCRKASGPPRCAGVNVPRFAAPASCAHLLIQRVLAISLHRVVAALALRTT